MDKNITVVAHCNAEHVFTPGVCIACERDLLRGMLERAAPHIATRIAFAHDDEAVRSHQEILNYFFPVAPFQVANMQIGSCAHLHIAWLTQEMQQGVRGWWACRDCGTTFVPMKVYEAEIERLNAELREWTETGHDATTQQSVVLMTEIERLRAALEAVEIDPSKRERYYDLRHLKHDEGCTRHGDQICQCGMASVRFNLEDLIDGAVAAYKARRLGVRDVRLPAPMAQNAVAGREEVPALRSFGANVMGVIYDTIRTPNLHRYEPEFNADGTEKHITCDGARYHVLSYSWRRVNPWEDGETLVRCSEPNCEMNKLNERKDR